MLWISVFWKVFIRLLSPLFEKKPYSNAYWIDGTKNLDGHYVFKNPIVSPFFVHRYEVFKKDLVELVQNGKSTTFYKFGDGDFHFLRAEKIGSASPGRRALSRELSKKELHVFQTRAQFADKYLCELYPDLRVKFRKVIKNHKRITPAEFAYAAVASKWLFKEFGNEIGLIGSGPKLELIRKLMNYDEYQKYLGLESFSDYIEIPQKFACDDLELRLIELKSQLEKSQARIFLLGVGHLKSGILSELPKIHRAVYLDVGTGIDAIAGVIDPSRPFFGNWINYFIPNDELYDEIDFLNYNFENRKALL